jgi:hypothetical protein
MRVPIKVLAAAAVGFVGLGSTASADPYKDLTAQGYRWVAVDGPYACPSKDDLQEITRHRTDLLEVKMVFRPSGLLSHPRGSRSGGSGGRRFRDVGSPPPRRFQDILDPSEIS